MDKNTSLISISTTLSSILNTRFLKKDQLKPSQQLARSASAAARCAPATGRCWNHLCQPPTTTTQNLGQLHASNAMANGFARTKRKRLMPKDSLLTTSGIIPSKSTFSHVTATRSTRRINYSSFLL